MNTKIIPKNHTVFNTLPKVPICQFLRVPNFCQQVGISNKTVLNLIHNGEIPAKRIGRQWFIPTSYLLLPDVER